MPAFLLQILAVNQLNDTPKIHYRNPLRHTAHKCQIMTDKNTAHVLLLDQIDKQLRDLILYRYIKCTGRFITDQQLRRDRDCSCNRHTLQLTAGKLMRIAHGKVTWQSYLLQEFFCLGKRLLLRHMVKISPWLRKIRTNLHSRRK